VVAVLGSARLGEGAPEWRLAHALGRELAERSATVLTGGYGGLMAAVSRGAHEAGGTVIGLPMTGWDHLKPNQWNTELRWAADYPSRLAELLACRAVIALPGGIGTLSELSVAWAASQTEADAPILIALGDSWREVLATITAHLVVDASDMALVHAVATADQAAELALGDRSERHGRARG
jgi:uncharacterized protein (TIGR00725 family)